jgi:hypothetical protein
MMTVRPIGAGELPVFLAVEPDPERAADQAAYLERLYAVGAMRRDWCFLAERAGRPVGRFAFWTLPNTPRRWPSSCSTWPAPRPVARALTPRPLLARALPAPRPRPARNWVT